MTATINASTSAGVVTTADTSGILQLQTNGTAALTVDASQNTTIAGTLTTTGVTTFAAGSAAAPAITTTGDTNTGIFFPAADTIGFAEGGAEAVRIDSDGDVGIGTSSPIAKLHVSTASASAAVLILNSSNNTPYMRFDQSNANIFTIGESSIVGGGAAGFYDFYAGARVGQRFFTGASERARITSAGDFMVGTTVEPTGSTGGSAFMASSVGRRVLILACTTASGAGLAEFKNTNGRVGEISVSGSSTSYLTSSDYRLKNTIAPMTGALAKVIALKPCTYKWKVDGSDGQGFIAHELAEVAPGCVSGAKDAVDAEGNPEYQGIDTSFLVATLTAAIQELKAIVDAQGAEIAALKGATA